MEFALDDDQRSIASAVAGLLEKRSGVDLLQRAWEEPGNPESRRLWADLAGMGVQGILVPEEHGGAGLDWVTMAAVLVELGRAATPLPVLETAAVVAPALAASGDPVGALDSLVAGSQVATAGTSLWPDALEAEWFLIPGEAGWTLHRRSDLILTAVRSVDRTRGTVSVSAAGPGVALRSAVDPFDAGALGCAALLIGLGKALLDATVAYVCERRQFGVPVGSFQAIKHHLADVAMHLEFATPAVWAAAWHADHPESGAAPGSDGVPGSLSRSVSLAKAMASDAASLAARQALQCHGAMGYAAENPLQYWMKRVWCLSAGFGTPAWHRRRIGAELGLHPEEDT